MKYLIVLLLLGGLAGAGLMLWLGFKDARKHSGDNPGDVHDR